MRISDGSSDVCSSDLDREYGDVTDEDLAAITVAAALVHGPEEVCTFLGRLQPLTARHSAATQTLERLMDIGREELVRAIGMTATDPYIGIAACRVLRHRGLVPQRDLVLRMIELFVQDRKSTRLNSSH